MAQRKIILVVDDDPGARRLLQFVLAKTGCEILTAANGNLALEMASNKTIDLLITDLMMDGMDGFALTQALMQIPVYARLPIIILSARGQAEGRTEILQGDNITPLIKPFSPIELTAKIQYLLKL